MQYRVQVQLLQLVVLRTQVLPRPRQELYRQQTRLVDHLMAVFLLLHV